jgi:ATP-dependent Clp protease ATP-binding subunit ClpC
VRKTPRVEQAIARAERIADGYGDGFIGTEHLLLGLAEDPDGIASSVLEELGVREKVRQRLRAMLEHEEYNREGRSP